MSDELIHLIEEKTDYLIEQTRVSSEETLDFKNDSPRQTFSSNSPLGLEKDK